MIAHERNWLILVKAGSNPAVCMQAEQVLSYKSSLKKALTTGKD